MAQEAAALKARLVDKFALQQVRHMHTTLPYTHKSLQPREGSQPLLCYVGSLSLCCVVKLTSLFVYVCVCVYVCQVVVGEEGSKGRQPPLPSCSQAARRHCLNPRYHPYPTIHHIHIHQPHRSPVIINEVWVVSESRLGSLVCVGGSTGARDVSGWRPRHRQGQGQVRLTTTYTT